MDIQLSISVLQICGALVPLGSFLGWGGYQLFVIGRTWQAASITLEEMRRDIAEIKLDGAKVDDKLSKVEARLNHQDTRIEHIETQFLTRIEILETLKRVEMMMMNFMQGKVLDNIPDLTTAVLQRQRDIDAKRREGKQ